MAANHYHKVFLINFPIQYLMARIIAWQKLRDYWTSMEPLLKEANVLDYVMD